ncbi:type III-A CRISPR-associated RAMP protein Csm5 [Methanobrevibacter olleyae]|uniref:CRISPR system Cms protein Csm5 n=1 Tax=Methanobrevibacter olleyae TaxID=294671 RepID=A0A126QZL7_METOL|nr:type III-A CRISPR-associated RAMP protein Csm5 [Methanobrevibacter olleyae]AMK15252.1 CRISPR-associated RAMP protein Csm5 family [Methanobrevibacter olleyae]SFL79978.1 CRISPR type III-A/MTUBE-associated RAMP protein Csm5 [Methanobrevibacter olleyae]
MESKVYKCKIRTISPVHIGSGKDFGPSEYVNAKAKQKDNVVKIIKRVDFAKFYGDLDENKQDRFLSNLSNPNYKIEEDFPKISKEYTRYNSINKSSISKDSHFAPDISEHIKTSDNLYIPGSSIKGAIKTAIFYDLLSDEDIENIDDLIQIRGNRTIINRRDYNNFIDEFFSARRGNSAQRSIMRFLQISDSSVIKTPTIHEVLSIMAKNRGGMPDGVESYSRNGSVVKSYIETIDRNKIVNSEFTLNYDEDILRRNEIGDKSFILDIDYIKKAIYSFSRDLIDYELDYAEKYKVSYLTKFYNSITKFNKEISPVLRIGAGSGLMATSIAMKVKKYDDLEGTQIFDSIRETFRRKYPYEFPKSRKVTKTGLPLSWVQLNFE